MKTICNGKINNAGRCEKCYTISQTTSAYCINLVDISDCAELYNASQSHPTDEDTMYDYISFANYFHKWKEKIQRGVCAIRPDEVFKEWETSNYRKECKALRDGKIETNH